MTDAVAAVDGVDGRIWLPIAECARLQSPPVSRQAMSKRVNGLVESGRLSTRPGPRGTLLVNIVALNRLIADETDPAQALRNRLPSPPLADDDEDDEDTVGGLDSGKPNYHRSRAEREAYQAEHSRLDLLERTSAILDREDVDRRTMTAFRKVRDRMLGLPAAWADKLAAAPDARAVRTMLAQAIRRELEGLAQELDHLGETEDSAAGDDAAGADGPDAED